MARAPRFIERSIYRRMKSLLSSAWISIAATVIWSVALLFRLFVFFSKSDICFYDSDKISCLTNLAKLTANQKDQLSQYIINCLKVDPTKTVLDESDLNEKIYEQYLHCIMNEKAYFKPRIEIKDLKKIFCVKGRLNQERIIAQSGSFLIYGLDAQELPENGNNNFTIHRIRIKKDDKETILEELDLLKINQRTEVDQEI